MDDSDRRVTLVCLDASRDKLDGGGKRVAAFLRALQIGDIPVEVVGVGPKSVTELDDVVASPLHIAKRHLLPVPLRRKIEQELAPLRVGGPTISLIPSANRWALRSDRAWLDFPDLWSQIARNHATTVGRVAAAVNRAQAGLWRSREESECVRAAAVSVASWSDRVALGGRAIWLPTPVAESAETIRSRRTSPARGAELVLGFLANFGYPPNRDAFDRLIRDWLPLLRTMGTRIIVAGFGSDDLPRVADVEIIGSVADLGTFYRSVDGVLAPITLGGGMKVKVVEAMMYGLPVVATEHAMQGLPEAIRNECISWDDVAVGPAGRDLAARLTDPREKSAVAEELESFTFSSFSSTFLRMWHEQMDD